MAQYGTIITNIGFAQIANAQITQTKVGLEYIALGDGNGAHYVPKQNQTALVHEVWRGPIAELSIDPTNSNRIIIDAVIPVTAGGFTIREIGIFDDKNNLIAVGQYPEKYKPQLSEGVSEETLIHFVIETNNADVVKLTIDPTVIIASRNYVDGKVAQVQTALTEHSGQIATTEKLGHIKVDGTTITVDPETGVASAQGGAIFMEASSDDGITYTATSDKITELVNGLQVVVIPTFTSDNTGNVLNLNINGLGNRRIIHPDGIFVRPVIFIANYPRTLVYNGYMFVLQEPAVLESLNSSSTIAAASANAARLLYQTKADKVQENYIKAVLTSGTQNSTNPISYFKDNFGIVHVTGNANASSGTLMFQMPVGYRPAIEAQVPILKTTGTVSVVNIILQPNGLLFVSGAIGSENYSLNLSYRAGA